MALTGSAFLDLVLVCTIAVFIVLVLLWPALAGPSIAKIVLRAGMLLTVNVLVLLTAATQLNAQYQWYADWVDLQGAVFGGPTAVTALSRGATAARATSRKVAGTAAKAGRRLPPIPLSLSLIHISEPTRRTPISYAA